MCAHTAGTHRVSPGAAPAHTAPPTGGPASLGGSKTSVQSIESPSPVFTGKQLDVPFNIAKQGHTRVCVVCFCFHGCNRPDGLQQAAAGSHAGHPRSGGGEQEGVSGHREPRGRLQLDLLPAHPAALELLLVLPGDGRLPGCREEQGRQTRARWCVRSAQSFHFSFHFL